MDIDILHITQDITHGITIIFVCAVLIVLASFIDMWSGIDAARANKERISSRSLRKTVAKITDYIRVAIFAVLIDILGLFFPWYNIPYAVIIATFGVLLIEGHSVLENLRRKKSSAANIVDVITSIIECTDIKQAEQIVKTIRDTEAKLSKQDREGKK